MISLILAAGKGTRMKSDKPKVLHEVNGVPMLKRVDKIMKGIKIDKNIFILGHKKEEILDKMGGITYVFQENQMGTGHAILIAKDEIKKHEDDVLITYGDAPLLTEETLVKMRDFFYSGDYDCVLLSCKVNNPFGYGRIIKENGNVVNIIEEKEATLEEKLINEVNTGVYMFKYEKLLEAVSEIKNDNSQGEYYLTDAIKILSKNGNKVATYETMDEEEVLGVNSKEQLAQASEILRKRKNKDLMDNGVILIDPKITYIEDEVEIGADTVIYPNVVIQGKTKIGKNCLIYGNSRIEDCTILDDVKIESSLIESSLIEVGVTIGPFAHIRPQTHLMEKVHIGNFVETKKATLESGVKVGHLTYIGDAEVGSNTNIGAGTITCNYDGKKKHKTKIGKNSFIGSNTILVSPVEVGERSFTAAGSVITKKVPDNALAFGRAKQTNKEGWNK